MTRRAVRTALSALLDDAPPSSGAGPLGPLVLVGCSGGTDSLALAAAAAAQARALGVRVGAIVVDHGLQDGSADVAARAARQCADLGLDPVEVVRVAVPTDSGEGPEGAARGARHAAFDEAAERHGALAVLLAHTRDDQAEQVLLGLARGSGARSLAGMPARRGAIVRPFLAVTRAETEAACAAWGLEPWRDPHNADPGYRRVRVRQALAALEDDLGPGLAAALARTADLLRVDTDHLEALADDALAALGPTGEGRVRSVPVAALATLPEAVRSRVWRRLLISAGAPAGSLSAAHVTACDGLLVRWRGQGPIDVPGPLHVARSGGAVVIGDRGLPSPGVQHLPASG
ncbi:tRNA lysidine(34) synthetase TilS [Janibacter sp. G1551]|uniref:tRNA lysidine(34) synthetase TilS n=1 Tax=Janibacter sp. G1551 TaxID=3420440 RepID=UPI003CFCC202